MKKQSGQAYVETLLILPIFVMFLVAITFFAKIYITKIILEQAARHGVFLIAYFNYSENEVTNEIISYVTTEKFLIEDIRRRDISVKIYRAPRFIPSSVTIKYRLKIPNLLAKIKGFPNPFIITGHSECFTGTKVFLD